MNETPDGVGSPRVLENQASGERIVLLRTAEETAGQLLEFELRLAPGGHVPSGHVHPQQEERFTVLEGRAQFRIGRRTVVAVAGQTITVPPGTAHRFANPGPAEACLLVEVRPALHMQELLETAAVLSRGGSRLLPGRPRLIDLTLFLDEFEREVRAPVLPNFLAQAVARPLAWIARAAGRDGRYRRLRAPGTPDGEHS
jgi:mannose-6-phosphate isomerase-like protein (cupin superfamily)